MNKVIFRGLEDQTFMLIQAQKFKFKNSNWTVFFEKLKFSDQTRMHTESFPSFVDMSGFFKKFWWTSEIFLIKTQQFVLKFQFPSDKLGIKNIKHSWGV